MSEIQKPVTERIAQVGNTIYIYMREYPGYHTKETLCNVVGWEYPKMDRQIRDVMAELSLRKPIISTSDMRGYKLAQKGIDDDKVRHQILENKARAEKILARNKQLELFIGG